MYLVSWSPLTIPPYPTVSLSSLSFRLVEIPARTQLYSPSYWSVRLEHTTKATRLTRLAVQQRSICGTGALVRAPSIVLYPVCRCVHLLIASLSCPDGRLPLPGPDDVKFGSETLMAAVGASREYQRCQDACKPCIIIVTAEGLLTWCTLLRMGRSYCRAA